MSGSGFAVIGAGRLGRALVARLTEVGWRCVALRARSEPLPGGADRLPAEVIDSWDAPRPWHPPDLLVMAVPDREIANVAGRMASELDLAGRVVLHTSGLHDAEEIAACRRVGAAVGSWHPLLSFGPSPPPPEAWQSAACAVEGDPDAVAGGYRLAAAVGLWPWTIRSVDKVRYHAAAALAGNLTHLCILAARFELEGCELPADAAGRLLRPLVEASTEAALTARGFEGLTGALARGDAATVERHLSVLPPDLASAYAALARWFRARRETGSD